MKNLIEILKQILFLISNFCLDVIKATWEPLLTKLLKITIISSIIFLIATLIPHNILFISNISYLGWVSLYCIINLLLYKIEEPSDFDVNNMDKQLDSDTDVDVDQENVEAIRENSPIEFLNNSITGTPNKIEVIDGTTRE